MHLEQDDAVPGSEFQHGCFNGATGNENTQNLECTDMPEVGCFNVESGDANGQQINCVSVGLFGCSNKAVTGIARKLLVIPSGNLDVVLQQLVMKTRRTQIVLA